jgi:septum formation protein
MLKNLKEYDVILGSNSPRRKELLKGLDIDFQIVSNDVDETYPGHIVGVDIPVYLARKKAESYRLTEKDLLITADTIVWFHGEVYGKPPDKDAARQMLRTLSGNMHQVVTGVCIRTLHRQKVFHAVSDVYFSRFSEEEINYYLEHYQPYDKAGSYGVQEWIGYVGVERIEGSYYNVMGLPIQRLYKELKNW